MSKFYIIATPIGNLQDITLRALETLKSVDVIVCEDTRITARLLEKYDIKNKKLLVYNDNSDENARKKILHILLSGSSIALVSDAGTPLISDPGYKLVRFLRENNIKIIPLPGPSSVLAALCASGIACDNFLFIGFLPNSTIQRLNIIKDLPKNFTLVFFESAQRIIFMLQDLQKVFGDRQVAVARELTKIHEEIISDKITKIIEFFQQNSDKEKGEFVVILEKSLRNEKNLNQLELEKEIKKLIASGFSIKELSEHLAEIYNLHKKEIYQLALILQKS